MRSNLGNASAFMLPAAITPGADRAVESIRKPPENPARFSARKSALPPTAPTLAHVLPFGRAWGEFAQAACDAAGIGVMRSAARAANPSGRLHSFVINTGFAWAHASRMTIGRPSLSEGRMKASARRYERGFGRAELRTGKMNAFGAQLAVRFFNSSSWPT